MKQIKSMVQNATPHGYGVSRIEIIDILDGARESVVIEIHVEVGGNSYTVIAGLGTNFERALANLTANACVICGFVE